MRGCPVLLASPTPGHGETRKKGKERGRKQERGFGSDNRRQKDPCQTPGDAASSHRWVFCTAFFT